MDWKFRELATPFEFSYFQILLFTTSKYCLNPGKFMEVFYILQHLRNNFFGNLSGLYHALMFLYVMK